MTNEEKNQLETLSLAYNTLEMNYREKCVENDKLKTENAELRARLEKIERDREFCEKEKIKEIFYEFIWAVKNLGHDALIRHLCFMVKAYCPQNIKLFVDI